MKELDKETIAKFIKGNLWSLPAQFEGMTSQETWLPYWTLNVLRMLQEDSSPEFTAFADGCISYVKSKECDGGGYGSGSGHMVLTYCAINSIALIGTREAYESVDRAKLYRWIMSRKQRDGSFKSEDSSEYDTRSTFCAISVASMLNMLTDELKENTVDFLVGCQNYDGGFSPTPGSESHSGYTYCAVAALSLLGAFDRIDVNSLIEFLVKRQMESTGGFNGRPNKLVDTCYSWWVGATCAIVRSYTGLTFWSEESLSKWVLDSCQTKHGLCDKPGVTPDMYHTMYGLAGMAVAGGDIDTDDGIPLVDVDPLHGVVEEFSNRIKAHFPVFNRC